MSKWLIVCLAGSTLLSLFGILNPMAHLPLIWYQVWHKFEIWRLVSCSLFLGMPSFPFLMSIIMFGQYSIRLEKDSFNTGGGGGSADYLWMLLFCQTVLVTLSVLFLFQPFLTRGLMFCIIYLWSRKNPNAPSSFWGFQVQAVYIPWVLVAFHLLIGDSVFMPLLGIAVGHLYYFLVDVMPEAYGRELISTPSFLIDALGWGMQGTGVQRFAPPGRASAPPRGYSYAGTAGGDPSAPPARSSAAATSSSGSVRYRWGSSGRVLGTS